MQAEVAADGTEVVRDGEDIAAAWMRHMRSGNWESAWRISDGILRSHAGEPCWRLPRHQQWVWDGTPLDGRRVLVRCYHGLGDTLQFIRFVPRLRAIAAEVMVWVQPALIPLLRTMGELGTLLPLHDGDPGVEYDGDVEVMELPHLFRATPETVSSSVPYLHVDPAPLAKKETLAVGLVWKAGGWDQRRDIPYPFLEPLAHVPGVELHILQRGGGLQERREGFGIVSGSDDAYQAARVMRALDLVISIDTFPAHLAGALGVPVWTLLQKDADWRWMRGRDDSPWYPTMRLFRQQAQDEWGPLIARVADELSARVRECESAKVNGSGR